eukprot:scaffold42201_cov17-Prasinocladus_malaysianus.AAC.1
MGPSAVEVNLSQLVQTEYVDVCSDIKSSLRSKPVVVCITELATFGHAGCALVIYRTRPSPLSKTNQRPWDRLLRPAQEACHSLEGMVWDGYCYGP